MAWLRVAMLAIAGLGASAAFVLAFILPLRTGVGSRRSPSRLRPQQRLHRTSKHPGRCLIREPPMPA